MPLTLEHAGVDLAGVGVVERHLAAGRPAQRDLPVEREGAAPQCGWLDDPELGVARAPRAWVPTDPAPLDRRNLGGRDGGSRVDLGPDRPEDAQEEEVQ